MCDPLASSDWTAMVTRVGTITGTVASLSEVLRTSCELISFLAAIWWGAGSGGTSGCQLLWQNGVLLTHESGGPAFARVTLVRERESYPLVSSGVAGYSIENGQGLKFFD